MTWVLALLTTAIFGGIIYQVFGKGRAFAFRHHQVLFGEVWIEPVLAKLGIRRAVAPLSDYAGFSACLEILRESPDLPLPAKENAKHDPHREPVYGDLYRVVVTAANGVFDKLTLTANRALTAPRPALGETVAGESYSLTCADPAVFGLLVPEVRYRLLAVPSLEIRDGRLLWPLTQPMLAMRSGDLGEPVVRGDWDSVLGFLEAYQRGASPFYRMLLMALFDPDPWYRTQAAGFLLDLCAGSRGDSRRCPIWPAKQRRLRLRQLGDLDETFLAATPDNLFAVLTPLLQHAAAEPALFAWDGPGSPQSPETVARLRAGTVIAEDLTPEGWLVAAILFPELASSGRLSQEISNLNQGAEFLLDELFDGLPEAEVDKLWPLLLHHPYFGAWVLRHQVAGIPHRLDYLAAYFFKTDDRLFQRQVLEFFRSQTNVRLGALVREALPYVLALGIHGVGVDALLIAGLQGLADIAEMDDLKLIERCSSRCTSDESCAAVDACRRAVWRRAGIDQAGLVSVAEAPDALGALSVVTDHRGELSTAPTSAKPDDAEH